MKPSILTKLPITIDYSKHINSIYEASFELGQLNGLHRNLPHTSLLIGPLTAKEAAISSKIEGTQSEVRDVLIYEATGEQKYQDTIEVTNYMRALRWSIEALKGRDLNNSFVKELHSLLLENTRGHNKRGFFREEQVFIGNEGDTIENAKYIPPIHLMVSEYMDNLENFINTESIDDIDLVKISIIHYQFEAIHPFSDGNGRIGRLLIPLYLYKKSRIELPVLYISGFFEKHKEEYKEKLHEVDRTGSFNNWIEFFLKSIKLQSQETSFLIKKLLLVHKEINEKLRMINSRYTLGIADFILQTPVFTQKDLNVWLKSSDRSVGSRLISKMIDSKIIEKADINGRVIYYNKDVMSLL